MARPRAPYEARVRFFELVCAGASVSSAARRLGVAPADLAVVGDDVRLDVALGHLGGSTTVLVRSGISGGVDLSLIPERRRPHAAVDTVADIIDWL